MTPEIQMEALLKQLARQFVDELPERFEVIEDGIRVLFEQPQNTEAFLELFRRVHSLKGAGGTYDAMILTHICHHMENVLNEMKRDPKLYFQANFRFYLHQYLDWMHQVYERLRHGERNFADIESQLRRLDWERHQTRAVILLVEPSATLRKICLEALKNLPIDLTVCEDGYRALGLVLHRHFDLVISGMRLPSLSGPALAQAINSELGKGKRPYFVGLTTDAIDKSVVHPGIDHLLTREGSAFEFLQQTVEDVLTRKQS